ncbi:helix-turn-helix domain-containing protein [Amycolatopsis sp. NPDC049253]|uniref:helix-turn-helix domain-containing protein n=1 Tax=Amycolatopsis sp. NPDC049253 TaxID=3155274 RepID=UPI00341D5754
MAETTVSPWMGTPEGATYTGRHAKTLLKALRRGELLGYQNGPRGSWRIHRDDLDAWIRGERPQKLRKSA